MMCRMVDYASRGSQRWLQIAVNRRPNVLREALVRSGAIGAEDKVEWQSPRADDAFRSYRDRLALTKAGVGLLKVALDEFWPARGPVWDAIGRTSADQQLFVEAKAHIAEAASPATRASETSRVRIEASLAEARRFYARRASARLVRDLLSIREPTSTPLLPAEQERRSEHSGVRVFRQRRRYGWSDERGRMAWRRAVDPCGPGAANGSSGTRGFRRVRRCQRSSWDARLEGSIS